MEQFWTIFWSAVGVLLTGLASWLSIVITQWLNSKIKDKTLARHATAVNDIVTHAVLTITQTYVENMKKNNAFDGEAQKEALNKCYVLVNTQLTQELRDYLTNNFGDIQAYLMSLIESTILRLKK